MAVARGTSRIARTEKKIVFVCVENAGESDGTGFAEALDRE